MKTYYMAIMTKDCRIITQIIMHGTREYCKIRANESSEKYGWNNKVLTAQRASGFDRFELVFTAKK